jgi:hypothetical protein
MESTVTDDSWFGIRSQYVRQLDRQITIGCINRTVIRIRANFILAHGMEVKLPHWEVQVSTP